MSGVKPGNIVVMIFKSLYYGINNICVGVFGIPASYAGMGLACVIFLFISIALFTGIRRRNSFSLHAQKN